MKTIKLLPLVFCVFFSPGADAKDYMYVDAVHACVRDADCVIAEDTCPGTWTAIHKDYVIVHQQNLDQMRPLIECEPMEEEPGEMPSDTSCIEKKCTIGQEP